VGRIEADGEKGVWKSGMWSERGRQQNQPALFDAQSLLGPYAAFVDAWIHWSSCSDSSSCGCVLL